MASVCLGHAPSRVAHAKRHRARREAQVRQISEPTFKLLSGMCFLRFNWRHFNKPWHPAWTGGDVLLQQRAGEIIAMLQAAKGGAETPIELELVEAYLKPAV